MKRQAFKAPGALALAAQAWGAEFEVRALVGGATPQPFDLHDDVAIVDICGPLTHHQEFIWDNYPDILARVTAAFACEQAKAVIMNINSPGGDVAGCFELARDLAKFRNSGKRFIAFADGMAASAAYALASAADEIVVSSTSFVGSIGVIEAMCDQTQADKAMGLNYVLVASGARKADGNPHVAISKEAVASMQGQVDGLAELFFTLVGDMRGDRGLTADKARALQAGMFFGDRAVTLGLADRVSTLNELIASAAIEDRPMPKATYMDEARKALKQAADEGNEMAKKMLALEDAPADEEKKDKADGKKAEADEKKPDAKAESDDDKKAKAEADDEKKAKAEADDDKKAKASVDAVFALTAEVHALRAEREAEKKAKAVADLFATRPDFDEKMRSTLSAMPLEKIREACETWPRVGAAANPRAAAASAIGLRGETQHSPDDQSPDANFIDRAMGLSTVGGAIKHERNTLELGYLTPAQARAKVAELDKKAAGK